jgi:hypothetical protein
MSKQLTFSACVAVLTMASFAIAAGHGGFDAGRGGQSSPGMPFASISAAR